MQVVVSQPLMSSLGNNVNVNSTASFVAPPISRENVAIKVSPTDKTKIYIDQLDKPIDNNVFVNSADINDDSLNL